MHLKSTLETQEFTLIFTRIHTCIIKSYYLMPRECCAVCLLRERERGRGRREKSCIIHYSCMTYESNFVKIKKLDSCDLYHHAKKKRTKRKKRRRRRRRRKEKRHSNKWGKEKLTLLHFAKMYAHGIRPVRPQLQVIK